ncbi:hypothetical protein BGZ65_002845 [Modicella reniformis]|uniref:Uncharacterized protein n=1 Tax=Modicella reniformis TaxID=1440133 RepID=A0A9P6ILK0_9FUNG|nr:hypothetical protein BGZ65_002845 [Modicella reniformis]
MALAQTFYNTVAPIRGPLQSIRPARYVPESAVSHKPNWIRTTAYSFGMDALNEEDRAIYENKNKEYDALIKAMDQDETQGYAGSPPPKRIRFSQKCSSCLLQGLDCSADRPVCSQCYYSTSKVTSILSTSTPPGLDSSSSSSATACSRGFCSYPTDALPLLPRDFVEDMMRTVHRVGEPLSKRLPIKPTLDLLRERTMTKDERSDVGWKTDFCHQQAIDQNHAIGVDYLYKATARSPRRYYRPFPVPPGHRRPTHCGPPVKNRLTEGRRLEETRRKSIWIERVLAKNEGLTTLQGKPYKPTEVKVNLAMRARHRLVPAIDHKNAWISLPSEANWEADPLAERKIAGIALNEAMLDSLNNDYPWGDGVKVGRTQIRISRNAKTRENKEEAYRSRKEVAATSATTTGDDGQGPEILEMDFGEFKSKKKVRRTGKPFSTGERPFTTHEGSKNSKKPPVPEPTEYKSYYEKSDRPWVPKMDEEVVPSTCGVPQKPFLQSLHHYASYYYTHANPCPDVFEAMDLPSHIALGMIIQEVISDFAFKLGKESQVEDIKVKQEKLEFARNLTEWEKAAATEVRSRVLPPSSDEDGPDMNQDLRQRIQQQKKEEQKFIKRTRRRWSKQCKRAILYNAGKDEYIDDDSDYNEDGHMFDGDVNLSVDDKYWEELRYLKQARFHPREVVSNRFLVNGHDTPEEKKDKEHSMKQRPLKSGARSKETPIKDQDAGEERQEDQEQVQPLQYNQPFIFELDERSSDEEDEE